MEIFRFVHITDLHLSDNPYDENPLASQSGARQAKWGWVLGQVFEQKNPLRPSSFDTDAAIKLRRQILESVGFIDAVVVTGDLATTGLKSDLSLARDFIIGGKVPSEWNSESQQYDPIPKNLPVIMMPGNHDRYIGDLLFPGGNQFEAVFGNDWKAGQTFPVDQSEKNVRRVYFEKNGKHFHVLCADFSLSSILVAALNTAPPDSLVAHVGQGHVKRNILNGLIKATNKIKSLRNDDVVIWATHFPPQFPNVNKHLKLVSENRLIRAANDCGVSLIISGHTHSDNHYMVESVPVICTGTACAWGMDEVLSFSIIEISIDKTEPTYLVRPYAWDEEKGYFYALPPKNGLQKAA